MRKVQHLPQRGNLVGYLIYRHETDDFLMTSVTTLYYNEATYTKSPESAYLFSSEKFASSFISVVKGKAQIVPLYDLGDRLAVGF